MLILFDHGTPKGLIRALPRHTVHAAQAKGWDTLSNGALLNVAETAGFELLLTIDQHRWSLARQHLAIAVASATPGSYAEVETPSNRRRAGSSQVRGFPCIEW